MKLRIFVEGPDGCGKTHIAQALAKHYGIPYFKAPTEKSNWMNDSFKSSIPFDMLLPEFVDQTGVEFVSDRCYMSEIVYSDVYDRETDVASLHEIDRRWGELNAVVVILIRRDYSRVEDELVKQSDLKDIEARYLDMMRSTRCTPLVMFVDDYNDDIEQQLPHLTRHIDNLKRLYG